MQNRNKNPQSSSSKIATGMLSAGIAGGSEAILFTPVDTAVTRVQVAKINHAGQSFNQLHTLYRTAIFKQSYNQSAFHKIGSLYDGFGFAFAYRSMRATYKFGGQIAATHYLDSTLGKTLRENLGEKTGQSVFEATTGGIIAVGDMMFYPLDTLKTKCQDDAAFFKKHGAFHIIKTEGKYLFNGGWFGLGRGVIGSFTMFGVSACVKQFVFGVDDHHQATKGQIVAASAAASVTTILVTNPWDVLKTRMQQLKRDQVEKETVSGFSIFKKLMKEEGASALMKGFTLRAATAAPRLMFTMALAQILAQVLQKPEESHAPRRR